MPGKFLPWRTLLRPLPLGLALLALTGAASARADVSLPHLFSDHMVMQCDTAVPVWGWAAPGERVQVAFAGQTKETTADRAGQWSLKLDPLAAGTRGTLTIQAANQRLIEDVSVGEVWLAAGQSNMQLRVDEAAQAAEAVATADLPQVRMFTVARRAAESAATDCDGQWIVCQPDTVGKFSAAGFYFARELHARRAVPVGLINSSWGATPIEAWTSPSALASRPEFAPLFAEWSDPHRPPQGGDAQPLQRSKNYPGNLFNGMIAPLIPYALRGAIWYQGENNANSNHPELYALQLPVLIHDWRQRWGRGDFQFAWVQLPNFQPKSSAAAKWPLVREAMRRTLALPHTGMAVAIDVGDAKNIHPKNKREVGHRLALWARAQVYGEDIPWSGPLFKDYSITGERLVVRFTHTDGGLIARDGALRGFFLAGADRHWLPADARIVGDTVVLSHPQIAAPRAARYGWADNPNCNLFNGAGLPASPFRTDDWDR